MHFDAVEAGERRIGDVIAGFLDPDDGNAAAEVDEETAMAALGPTDLGIKVGSKPSLASHRVADVSAMAAFLTELADEREAWNAAH